jgi:integrase
MTTKIKNTSTTYKTLPKRNSTKKVGVYFKEIQKTIIDEKGNLKTSISDKLYIIKFKDIDEKWRTKTIGKYSEGIRENYCHTKRIEILNSVKLGEQPPIIKKKIKKKVIVLHDVFTLYKEHKATESKDIIKTEQKYKSNIYKLFGCMDINEVTTDKIVSFRKSLIDKGRANSTINSNISFIGTLFNFAIEEGIYSKVNPIKSKRLKALKLDNKREKYLTLDEVKKLYEAIKDDAPLTLFVKLSLNMGSRLETTYNIRKKDINLDYGTITLYDFKREMTYTSFVPSGLRDELKELMTGLTANSRIIDTSSSRIIQRGLKKHLDTLFNQGLAINDRKNRAVVHTLRHTFASHLAINSIPIFTIKELMNHANIDMTMRYAKLSPNNGKVAIQGLYR